MTGDPQDTLGVREGARSEGLVRNRRDSPRRPTSGEGGGYEPMAKCHRAGRGSEGLVVPWMALTRTTPEGRGPALVVSVEEGKGEGMPARANNPTVKARKPQSRPFIGAKRPLAAPGSGFPAYRLVGLTILTTDPLEVIRLVGGLDHRCVVEIDIEKFFDSIDHKTPMKLVELRTSHRKVLQLQRTLTRILPRQ